VAKETKVYVKYKIKMNITQKTFLIISFTSFLYSFFNIRWDKFFDNLAYGNFHMMFETPLQSLGFVLIFGCGLGYYLFRDEEVEEIKS